jgi:hypothetical protein
MSINLDTNDIVRMFQVRATAELKRELDEVKWWEDRGPSWPRKTRASRRIHSGVKTYYQDKTTRSGLSRISLLKFEPFED